MKAQLAERTEPGRNQVQKFVAQSSRWVEEASKKAQFDLENILAHGLARAQQMIQQVRKDKQNSVSYSGSCNFSIKNEIIRYRKNSSPSRSMIQYKNSHKAPKKKPLGLSFFKTLKSLIGAFNSSKQRLPLPVDSIQDQQRETFIYSHQAEAIVKGKHQE